MGELTGYYPLQTSRQLLIYVGIAMFAGALTALLIVATLKMPHADGRAVGLSILGVFATGGGILGVATAVRDRDRAVFLFEGGFVIVTRPHAEPGVFAWWDIIKVRKRVSAFQGFGWTGYTEVERGLEAGRLAEKVDPRVRRSGPATARRGVRCSYLVWRADGLLIWLKPEYRNVYELGETILRSAPAVTPGPLIR